MKRLLLQIGIFGLLVLGFLTWLVFQPDGVTDGYYLKFSSPPQQNMIFGTSKAAQGMQPAVFREVLGLDIYNFAFTISDSPYGPYYLDKIKQKVKPGTTDGVFVLTVDPWAVSTISSTPNDPKKFYEYKSTLGLTRYVNLYPNVPYLWENYNYQYYRLAFPKRYELFLHDDGWLEVDVPMDTGAVAWRLRQKVKDYGGEKLRLYNYSSLRFEYLKETIEWLDERGEVYLVWLPTHPEIYAIGQELCPQFDSLMQSIAPMTEGYLNLMPENDRYDYTDGNHLYKRSGKVVSRRVAEWISQQSDSQKSEGRNKLTPDS